MKQDGYKPPELSLRDTPFGPVAVLWSIYENEPKICRILLSHPGGISAGDAARNLFPGAELASSPTINPVLDQIEAFLSGEDVRFAIERLCLDLCSPFHRSVLLADFTIPRGRFSTYKLLARRLGNPGGSRAVGTALANNPFPLIIPCHRVIRSDGGLGGFQYGLKMKRALLEIEGIAFRDEDHVATQDFFFKE